MAAEDSKDDDPFARIATALRDDAPPRHPTPRRVVGGKPRQPSFSNLAPVLKPDMVPPIEIPEANGSAPPPIPVVPSVIVNHDPDFDIRPSARPHIDLAPTTIRGRLRSRTQNTPFAKMLSTKVVIGVFVLSIMVFALGLLTLFLSRR